MNHLLFLLCGLVLLAAGGCVRSEQPLNPVAEAKPDPLLVGRWQAQRKAGPDAVPLSPEDQAFSLQVSFDEHGLGTGEFTGKDGEAQHIHFTITRTPKHALLSARDGAAPKPLYDFYKYQVAPDGKTVQLWDLRTDLFEEAVRAGQLKGVITEEKPGKGPATGGTYTMLQDTSAHVLAFIEAKPDAEVFKDLFTLEKVE